MHAITSYDHRYSQSKLLRKYASDIYGTCRITIYMPDNDDRERRPIVLCRQMTDDAKPGVTTMVECIAASIIGQHFPEALTLQGASEQPVRWIGHWGPNLGIMPRWDDVSFQSWALITDKYEAPRLGRPLWKDISDDEVAILFGSNALR